MRHNCLHKSSTSVLHELSIFAMEKKGKKQKKKKRSTSVALSGQWAHLGVPAHFNWTWLLIDVKEEEEQRRTEMKPNFGDDDQQEEEGAGGKQRTQNKAQKTTTYKQAPTQIDIDMIIN